VRRLCQLFSMKFIGEASGSKRNPASLMQWYRMPRTENGNRGGNVRGGPIGSTNSVGTAGILL
jgi:hypothetical protein